VKHGAGRLPHLPRDELGFVGFCDISGHVKGKGFPRRDLQSRLARGVGWTPSDMMRNAFGAILDTPFRPGGNCRTLRAARGICR
jgi:glutamine synthetase